MKICSVDGCNSKHHANGYCEKHNRRMWRYGNLELKGHASQKTHGMSYTPEYRTWASMKQRCYNKQQKEYKNWGGRGITVCDRWLNSFENFIEDMGIKPFPKAQIDRIDNDGNYEPSNCEWVTSTINMRHTRSTKLTMDKARVIRGVYKYTDLSLAEIGGIFGVSRHTIRIVIENKIWKE